MQVRRVFCIGLRAHAKPSAKISGGSGDSAASKPDAALGQMWRVRACEPSPPTPLPQERGAHPAFPLPRDPRSRPLSPWERGWGEGPIEAHAHASLRDPRFKPLAPQERGWGEGPTEAHAHASLRDPRSKPLSPWERGWGEGSGGAQTRTSPRPPNHIVDSRIQREQRHRSLSRRHRIARRSVSMRGDSEPSCVDRQTMRASQQAAPQHRTRSRQSYLKRCPAELASTSLASRAARVSGFLAVVIQCSTTLR